MKYTVLLQSPTFSSIKLATPFNLVRHLKMKTLNKTFIAALLAVAATSTFAAETQVETAQAAAATESTAPASEAAASDVAASSEAQAN